jgi:hypothetical protein
MSAASSALVRSAEPNRRLEPPWGGTTRADDPRRRLAAAGQRDADRIENADLGPKHRIRGQVLETQCGRPPGEFVRELHDDCLPVAAADVAASNAVAAVVANKCVRISPPYQETAYTD